ncbi:MAG TPA: hypothetical protein VG753_00060 [Candidatus Paceibacterota bacterium]|nr:hypothetical protein [Candidatus Paceibacterota bacterium]
MGRKILPPAEQYTGDKVLTITSTLREDGMQSLGESFCKRFGTAECPHDGKCPNPGYCSSFLFKASDIPEATHLFLQDADQHRLPAS